MTRSNSRHDTMADTSSEKTTDTAGTMDEAGKRRLAAETWGRYVYALNAGHRSYITQARHCERMYLGGGRQWRPADLDRLRRARRPAYEINEILPAVNAAIGHQISNRMDISFRPRGQGTDQAKADLRAKVAMAVAERTRMHWRETEVFADGLIQQRGFFEVRMDFTRNINGDISVLSLDPLDVAPDPDAKTYEPDGWADVCVSRWLTLDEVEDLYGEKARSACEGRKAEDDDFGADDETEPRNSFGGDDAQGHAARLRHESSMTRDGVQRVRVVDRQFWRRVMCDTLYYPRTGDLRVAEGLPPDMISNQLGHGAEMIRTIQRRVRWHAAAQDTMLHDDWSPYGGFTVVPFFPFFRRGQTIGLVDNAIGPQEILNKATSQAVHIINTTANGGWTVEQNSLTNMTTEQLSERGAESGIVIEHKPGMAAPKKIESNAMPQGMAQLIDSARNALRDVTVPEAMRGLTGPETAGIAIQARQKASVQQLAMPLDNLGRTRSMMAVRLNELMTKFMTAPQVLRITEQDPRTGKPVTTDVELNEWDEEAGTWVNDMTDGDYDIVVTEQPVQASFEAGQFQQALELRQAGVALPDTVMVEHSSLSRKADILGQMASQDKGADPAAEAKIGLLQAQTRKTLADAVSRSVEAMYSATQAGNQIAMLPQIAPLADKLLLSAGFADADAAPIVPGLAAPISIGAMPQPTQAPMPNNTNPLTPANPDVGLRAGIERPDPAAGAAR